MLNIGEFARLGQVSPRMLRHYDQLGLLVPERVDPDTGYRSYGVQQLGRLHQLLALRDLGFTLVQIGDLLHDELNSAKSRAVCGESRRTSEQSKGAARWKPRM
jgi:DNA-binding transcriptional MerR regulator